MPQPLKAALRKRFLEARRGLPAADVARWSAEIRKRLWQMPEFVQAESVFGFVGSKDNETDTLPLLERVLESGRQLLLPVTEPGGIMAWQRVTGLNRLRPARFGILEPEPEESAPCPIQANAAALVPGIVFSPPGARIGYGGGYFDRFLEGFCGVKIALAYDLQLEEKLPVEAHDVCMDYIVTPSRTFDCAKERATASSTAALHPCG